MSMNDLTSDFAARVNNSIMVEKKEVKVLKNNLILNLCKKLTRLGYFESFESLEREVAINLNLNKVHKIKRISKPGLRVYTSYTNMPKIVGGIGFNILSTSTGIKTSYEAQKEKTGGELLFQVF
jgi:small subunit ribosomal protein S8